MNAPVVELCGVSRRYPSGGGALTALDGVDFALAPGAFIAITGPSGSGKTTLLNLAALLDRPTRGEVRFEGQDVARLDDDALSALRRRAIGVVFQAPHLLPERSVFDNVLFRFRYLDVPASEARRRAHEVLDAVGLTDRAHHPARLLSGGEMQRCAIARALAQRPQLLAADEPTGNLDADSATAVMQLFAALHREGLTILLVTHNTAWLAFASRHVICRNGHLREVPP